MTENAGTILIVTAGFPATWMLAQTSNDPGLSWVGAVAQLGSTGVALVMSWWFIQYITKKDEVHSANMAALSKAHSDTMANVTKENREFLAGQAEKCHEVHRESTLAVKRSAIISARAAYVIEQFAVSQHVKPGQPGPSDSVILKNLENFDEGKPG